MTVTSNLELIHKCDTDDWTGDPTVSLDEDFMREGVGCMALDCDVEVNTGTYALPSQTNFTDCHFMFWALVMTKTLDVQVSGGIRFGVEDSSGNLGWWYLAGDDTYKGGWESFVVCASASFHENNGSDPDITQITDIHVGFKCVVASKLADNCYWDYVRYLPPVSSSAITVTGGTSGSKLDWQNVYEDDDSAAIGAVTKNKGIFYINAPVQFGDDSGTADCYFEDTGQIILFSELPVSGTFYKLIFEGNTVGTSSIKFGVNSGGRGIQGCVVKALYPSASFQIVASSSNINELGLYGTTFLNASTINLPASASNREVIDCSFVEGSAEVKARTCWIQHSFFISAVEQAVCITTSSHNVRDSNFINCTHGINFPNSGTYDLRGLNFSGCTYDVENSSLSGSVTINNLVGSNAQSSHNTAGGTTSINTQRILTLSGLQTNSEVRILDSNREELEGTESSGTSYQYNYNYVGAATIYIVVHHLDYTHIWMEYTLTDSNQSIPIQQKTDRVYNNP